jgi:crotonobetainyl-CoA:carnitine CoA-transferase CaiB-like acyl-CoA transferase
LTPAALPLGGLTVLDLSRVLAGPYATQILGDLGAEVWKVERPGSGDETRAWGPPFVDGESAYYLSVNRNKKSAVLELASDAGRAAVRRAALAADVVVENFLPGDLARLGLDLAALRREKPALVTCSITGFGQTGPYADLPGYDAVLQGFTGLMSVTGEAGGPAVKVGVAVVDVMTGAHAAAAVLAALVGVFRGRGGTALDIALFEVGVAALVNVAQSALVTGQPARRHGNAHPTIVPYQTFETADGPMVIAVGNDAQWRRLCGALGPPDLAARAAWAGNPDRVLHRAEVVTELARRLAARPRAEWLARLRAARVPAGAVRDVHEVLADPALEARGMVQRAPRGEGAGAPTRPPLLALPWLSDGMRAPVRLAPPRLGEHTAEFMARFGLG